MTGSVSTSESGPSFRDRRSPSAAPRREPPSRLALCRELLVGLHGASGFVLLTSRDTRRHRVFDHLGVTPSDADRIARALDGSDVVARWHRDRWPEPDVLDAGDVLMTDPESLVSPGSVVPRLALPLVADGEGVGVLVWESDVPPIGSPARLSALLAGAVVDARHAAALHTDNELARSLLREVSVGLIAIDPVGRVTYLNAAGERILGVAAGEAVGADSLRVFRTLVDGENVLLDGLEADLPGMEVWLRRGDGREMPVNLEISPIRDSSGETLGAVGTFQDFSEMRSMQERLRHRDRLATIGELAAGIAHEIGNPLTGIRGCAQVLGRRLPEGDGSHDLISAILEEVDRLGRLSKQIRHYVRPRPPEMARGDVSTAVERVLTIVEPRLDELGISVHWSRPTLPEIYFDPDQMQQVIHNLVQNAVDAMADGGGRLEIGAKLVTRSVSAPRRGRRATDRTADAPRQAEREYVRITVSDTGQGIPADVVERVFNPFFTTKSTGLGLGLSISQTVVTEHAGFLSVVSQAAKGTTFTLDLPVDRRA